MSSVKSAGISMRLLWMSALSAATLLASPAAQTDSAEDDIRQARAQSNAAIARHDAVALGSYLADNFVITISTGAIERSRQEHIDSFKAHFAEFPDVVYVRTPTTITISES